MAFVGPDQPDEQPFVGPDAPDDTASMTFPQKFEAALTSFQRKLYPVTSTEGNDTAMNRLLEGATFPFRLPGATAAAVETMFPGTGEAISNSTAARLLGPIPQVAEAVDALKFEANQYDTGLEATGKAAANIGLELGKQLASPMGVATALGSVLSAPATAATFLPTVLDAAESASREIASDAPTQQKIEAAIMASLGLVGTVAGLRANLPKSGVGAARKPPELNPVGKEALQGAAELERIFGNEAPLTPAELSQNPMTARRENFIRKVADADPNSTRPLAYQIQQRSIADIALKAIREKADEAGTKTEVGAEAAKQIQAADEALARRAGQDIGRAAQEVAGEAEAAVRRVGPEMEATDLGLKVRDSANFTQNNKRATATALYDDAEQALTASGAPAEFIDLKQTRSIASKILADAPKKEVVTTAGTTREVIPQFLPAFNKIQEIANWTTPQSAKELTRARSLIGEAIGRLESGVADTFGGGFQLGDLKRIYGALSQDFDNSLAAVSPDAQTKYKKAQSFYKENVEKFEQNPVLKRILNSPAEGGIANTAEIVGLFAKGEGKLADLQAIRDFLPAADYDALKAGVLDSLRSRSTIPTAAGAVEDLTTFAQSFRKIAPEVKRELLGSDKIANELQSTLDQFGVVKKGTEVIGKTVPAKAMAQLVEDLRAGNATVGRKRFGEAVAKEQARITDYNNEITAGIRNRDLGSVKRNPAQFVDDFLLKSNDVATVERALQLLEPATRNRVKALATQTFIETAFDPQRTTLSQIGKGEVAVDLGKLIENYTKDPAKQRVINALIPEEDRVLVESFLKYQRGIETARKLGGSSGLVAANSVFGGSLGGGLLSTTANVLESFAKNAVTRKFAEAYFSKRVRPVFELTTRGEFLTTSVAAALKANINPNTKLPTLTQEALRALISQYGVSNVQNYLNTKADVDKLMARMTEDEQAAVLAIMPEVATPMVIEGLEATYTPPDLTNGPPVRKATQMPAEVSVDVPNQFGRNITKKLSVDAARKALEEQRALLQKYRQQLQ